MKKLYILFTIICLTITTYSQPTVLFGIKGGASIPSGNVSKTDYTDINSGYAKSGGFAGINATLFLKKKVGVGLDITASQFGLKNTTSLADAVIEAYELDEGADISTTNWKFISVMPYFNYRLVDTKVFADAKVFVGYTSVTTPKIDIGLEDNNILQSASTGGSLSYGLGISVGYKITDHLGVDLNANYISVKPDIDVTTTGINNTVEGLRNVNNYNSQIGILNAGAGISFMF